MLKSEAVVRIAKSVIIGGVCFCLLACGLTARLWQRREVPLSDVTSETISAVIPGKGNHYGAYLAGYLAQKNQDYERTAFYFERVLSGDPENEKLKASLYFLKAVQGQFDDMLPLVRDIAAMKRPELLADYVLMAHAVRQGDYGAAADFLKRKPAYGLDPVLKPAVEAWLFAGEGKRKEAEAALKGVLKEPKMEPFYLYYSGLIHLYLKDEDAADKDFRRLAESGYPSLTALVFIRDFYEKRGQWRVGESVYDQFQKSIASQAAARDVVDGLKRNNDITPAEGISIVFYDMSVALGPLGIEETSLLFNELALYLAPTATIPKIWGAEVFESIKGYRAANRMYDRIREPSDIILFKKAINLMTEGAYGQAVSILRDISRRNRGNPLVQRLLGESYSQVGDYASAVKAYERAAAVLRQTERRSELGRVLFETGAAYDEMGEADKSEKVLLEALQMSPNDALILNYLGYSWLEQGKNPEEAFEMVQKANELMPDDPHIMDSLALGYYYKKEYQKALILAERSTDMIPYSSVAYSHLGDIYAAMGRYREAIYQYRKALDLTADMTPELRRELERKISSVEKRGE